MNTGGGRGAGGNPQGRGAGGTFRGFGGGGGRGGGGGGGGGGAGGEDVYKSVSRPLQQRWSSDIKQVATKANPKAQYRGSAEGGRVRKANFI